MAKVIKIGEPFTVSPSYIKAIQTTETEFNISISGSDNELLYMIGCLLRAVCEGSKITPDRALEIVSEGFDSEHIEWR